MLFQYLYGFKPVFYSTHSDDEPKFMAFLSECSKNEKFNKLAPRSERTEQRYEGIELVSRFFAYFDNYLDDFPGYSGNVAKYIDKYIENMNKIWEKDSAEGEYRKLFQDMLNFAEDYLGSRGFRKKEKSKSTPRARFEALAVGIALALQEKPNLEADDNAWVDGEEFSLITRSDAANNKSKLKRRIDFVKNKLVGE